VRNNVIVGNGQLGGDHVFGIEAADRFFRRNFGM
jgi:hypothetical protein